MIPHYDFNQIEKVEGPPDIDDVLEEIRQRDIVEEIISPVFFISLVLNVPTHSNVNSSKSARDISHKESKVKWSLPNTASKAKGVTFDEATETGTIIKFLYLLLYVIPFLQCVCVHGDCCVQDLIYLYYYALLLLLL